MPCQEADQARGLLSFLFTHSRSAVISAQRLTSLNYILANKTKLYKPNTSQLFSGVDDILKQTEKHRPDLLI